MSCESQKFLDSCCLFLLFFFFGFVDVSSIEAFLVISKTFLRQSCIANEVRWVCANRFWRWRNVDGAWGEWMTTGSWMDIERDKCVNGSFAFWFSKIWTFDCFDYLHLNDYETSISLHNNFNAHFILFVISSASANIKVLCAIFIHFLSLSLSLFSAFENGIFFSLKHFPWKLYLRRSFDSDSKMLSSLRRG